MQAECGEIRVRTAVVLATTSVLIGAVTVLVFTPKAHLRVQVVSSPSPSPVPVAVAGPTKYKTPPVCLKAIDLEERTLDLIKRAAVEFIVKNDSEAGHDLVFKALAAQSRDSASAKRCKRN